MESTERRTENSATIITPWSKPREVTPVPDPDADFRARYERVCALALEYYTKDAAWTDAVIRRDKARDRDDVEAEVHAQRAINALWNPKYAAQQAYEKACREFFMNDAI